MVNPAKDMTGALQKNKHKWRKAKMDKQQSANLFNFIGNDALTLPRLTFDCKPWSAVT